MFLSCLLWLPAVAQFTQQANKLSGFDAIGSAQQGQSVAIGNKLVGTGSIGNARQGTSVTASGDGSTVIVGGPSDNSWMEAAWVYAVPPTAASSFSIAISPSYLGLPITVDGVSL